MILPSRLIAPATALAAAGLAATLVFASGLRDGFVYLDKIDPTIAIEVRYATSNNFVGDPIEGYEEPRIILTKEAADALRLVQAELKKEGLALKVFDGYRPRRAVDHFVRWTRDRKDTRTKKEYYPGIPKTSLLSGYIGNPSRHSSGSTVDLTLVDETGKELDMGTPFDFFGEESSHHSTVVTPAQSENRAKLKQAMSDGGFRSYHREWWHYTLRNEPFENEYFDFPVR